MYYYCLKLRHKKELIAVLSSIDYFEIRTSFVDKHADYLVLKVGLDTYFPESVEYNVEV